MGRGERVRITGLMPVYNALSAHYPFLEGIVLACEIVDEMVIQDGGSTDGTREAIEELAKCLPVPLRFVDSEHFAGEHWVSMDVGIEKALKTIDGGWVYEVQCDEFCPLQNRQRLLDAIEYADKNGYNAIRHPMIDIIGWEQEGGYVYRNVRVFRWRPDVRSKWGGDSFYFEGQPEVRQGFTSHNLPPELDVDFHLRHLKWNFGGLDIAVQAERHYTHYAIGAPDREYSYQWAQDVKAGKYQIQVKVPERIHPEVPEIYHGLIGLERYEVRPEVFEYARKIKPRSSS